MTCCILKQHQFTFKNRINIIEPVKWCFTTVSHLYSNTNSVTVLSHHVSSWNAAETPCKCYKNHTSKSWVCIWFRNRILSKWLTMHQRKHVWDIQQYTAVLPDRHTVSQHWWLQLNYLLSKKWTTKQNVN